MNTIQVKSGQSLLDMSVEHSGGMEGAFRLAAANGMSLTDDPVVGDKLKPSSVVDDKVAVTFGNMVHKPASGLTGEDLALDDNIRVFDDTFDLAFE